VADEFLKRGILTDREVEPSRETAAETAKQ
jgi:hypothetical protein